MSFSRFVSRACCQSSACAREVGIRGTYTNLLSSPREISIEDLLSQFLLVGILRFFELIRKSLPFFERDANLTVAYQ